MTAADTQDEGFGNAFCGMEEIFSDVDATFDISISGYGITPLFANNKILTTNCLFFRRRNVCDGASQQLSLKAGPAGFSIAGSNFPIDVEPGILGLLPAIAPTPSLEFSLEQTALVSNVGKIVLNYNRLPSHASVFRILVNY